MKFQSHEGGVKAGGLAIAVDSVANAADFFATAVVLVADAAAFCATAFDAPDGFFLLVDVDFLPATGASVSVVVSAPTAADVVFDAGAVTTAVLALESFFFRPRLIGGSKV